MEKITCQPLIKHLNERSDYYNQLYRENELKYSQLDHSLISLWIVNTIEPIINAIHTNNPDQLPQVFKAFYTELLKILGNKTGIVHENEYRQAWALCLKNPMLVGTSPARLIKAIDSALESIRTYQPDRVNQWISFLDNTIAVCKTVDEFLACGRIYAWLCGMAHLRSKAEIEYNRLSGELKQIIINNDPITKGLGFDFQSNWIGFQNPRFVGEVGGFIGFGGVFVATPMVAQINNEIIVTDKKNSFLFFADSYGKVLLSEIPISPDRIIRESSKKEFKAYRSKLGEALIPFDDISSCVVQKSTLVLTRASSHYLFVYGLPQ